VDIDGQRVLVADPVCANAYALRMTESCGRHVADVNKVPRATIPRNETSDICDRAPRDGVPFGRRRHYLVDAIVTPGQSLPHRVSMSPSKQKAGLVVYGSS